MKIFIIVKKTKETYGHGDFGTGYQIASKDPYELDPYPFFFLKEDAEKYLEKNKLYFETEIIELEEYENIPKNRPLSNWKKLKNFKFLVYKEDK